MKKIIDDKGRVFGLISIIDVIVLLVVVVLAIAAYTKFNVHDSPLTPANTVGVTYTVRVSAIRLSATDMMRRGDSLYTNAGTFIGTIKDIGIEEAYSLEQRIDGIFLMARIHDRYDITLTVEAQCSYNNGRYYADKIFELNANAEQKMQTKYNEFTGTIMTITAG